MAVDNSHQNPERLLIAAKDIASTIKGVQAATKTSEEGVKTLFSQVWDLARQQRLSDVGHELDQMQGRQDFCIDRNHGDECNLTAQVWKNVLDDCATSEQTVAATARLAIGISMLRSFSRHESPPSEHDLAPIWDLIFAALRTSTDAPPLFSAQRSSQGFVAIPLCSLIVNGSIDQLWRLHVWLPDGKRGNPLAPVHSHQAFAQSWVLAGKGTDCQWDVKPASSREGATHT